MRMQHVGPQTRDDGASMALLLPVNGEGIEVVTREIHHSVLVESFDKIFTCGPTPMMKAVARYAKEKGIACEASLENLMACGLGACLCCVEKTTEGNLCVCKEGPVFNTQRLLW